MLCEFIVLLKFMINVTRTTNSLTIHLQTTELEILSSFELVTNTKNFNKKMRNDEEALKNTLLVSRMTLFYSSLIFQSSTLDC